MMLRGVAKQQIADAWVAASMYFGQNIETSEILPGRTHDNRPPSYRLSLLTSDITGPGHSLTKSGSRHKYACQHVINYFLELLPETTEYRMATPKGDKWRRVSDRWGGEVFPECDCVRWRRRVYVRLGRGAERYALDDCPQCAGSGEREGNFGGAIMGYACSCLSIHPWLESDYAILEQADQGQ